MGHIGDGGGLEEDGILLEAIARPRLLPVLQPQVSREEHRLLHSEIIKVLHPLVSRPDADGALSKSVIPFIVSINLES